MRDAQYAKTRKTHAPGAGDQAAFERNPAGCGQVSNQPPLRRTRRTGEGGAYTRICTVPPVYVEYVRRDIVSVFATQYCTLTPRSDTSRARVSTGFSRLFPSLIALFSPLLHPDQRSHHQAGDLDSKSATPRCQLGVMHLCAPGNQPTRRQFP